MDINMQTRADLPVSADELFRKLENKTALVAIVGLGYVGLPLMLAFDAAGFQTLGFDIDQEKLIALREGRSYLNHFGDEVVASLMKGGRCSLTSSEADLRRADAICLCVPTPITKTRDPDMSYVLNTAEMVSRNMRPGQIVVLESTTYPGATDTDMAQVLARSGLKNGMDYFIGYSPEREDPGNPDFSTGRIPKIVSGDDAAAAVLCRALYSGIVEKVVPVSSTRTAEAVKLTENIFRAVNIALVNELKVIFDRMGIDVWEVIDAARTKPFGFMPFYPGPGLGGHCIPIDPFYLSWKAREFGANAQFIELAGLVNSAMPRYVMEKLIHALSSAKQKSVSGARILLVGIAYKKNINDMRESPSLVLMEELERLGAQVAFHDPHVPVIPMTREHAALAGRHSVDLGPGVAGGFDVVLIATDHDSVDYGQLVRDASLVVDTRNRARGLGRDDIVFMA
jgi:UDP-N-acetyl-D-glucosamine dehydrogenase